MKDSWRGFLNELELLRPQLPGRAGALPAPRCEARATAARYC